MRRPPKPLTPTSLRDLATTYVARFATSTGKLESYLARKLRERGWHEREEGEEGEDLPPPDIPALVARFAELGYVDDAAYARDKAGALLRRGYGARRVGQALYAAGIDEATRASVDPEEAARREAAITLARKRRFGPFHAEPPDRKLRDKQVAAMLRAGHGFDHVRFLMDAPSEAALEEWLAEAADPLE